MDDDALLRAYDTSLRGEAEMDSAPSWDRDGPLFRAVHPGRGFVSYENLGDLDAAGLAALVAATVAYYRDETDVPSFEWKTRGHDDLPDLDTILREAGFEPEDVETVMVGEATALAVDVPLRPGLGVRRLETDAELAEAHDVAAGVFGRGGPTADRDENTEQWAGFDGEAMVATGRLAVVPGTEFAGLWGGAVVDTHRGLGLYRALTAGRARSALARGVRFLQSDCTVMSRPILERSGLRAVTTTTPYVWTRTPAEPDGGDATPR